MKILVAMSGGVDSSVAAQLLTEAGHECVGCTMKLFGNEDAGLSRTHTCCSLEDVEDARSVACRLGIPYYVFNFQEDFREKVMDKFVASYCSGYTPNPCIDCNHYMKFDKLFSRADVLGCSHIATGHYARIAFENGRYVLKKALDAAKDQSYVLYHMTQQQLSRTLFPLGELEKTQTRVLAEAGGLLNAGKPDSQDICFVPDGDYAGMIRRYTGQEPQPGAFVDQQGHVLGCHDGIIHYTIGQHRGLGLSLPERMAVCRICPEDNTVVLGREQDLYTKEAEAAQFHWISGEVPKGSLRCRVKIRYRQPEQWAAVMPLGEERIAICFDQPQRAITPGQAAVLYQDDVVLGGGTIVSPYDAIYQK